MADRKKLRLSLFITLSLVGLNLIALNALLAGWPSMRVDMTEDRLYSISPATRRILSSLDENVLITGYFSSRTHPKLAPLVPQIVDLLEEYRAVSGGKVDVEIVDPGEDDAAEEEANSRFGVSSTPFRLASKYESGIVNAYFAIVVRYGDQYVRYGFGDLIDVEPLPDGDVEVKLHNLEYDITRAIKKVVYGFRSTAELFERIDKPVRFTAIMTPDALPEVLQKIPEAVRKAAADLEEKGGDRFTFEEIDPSKGGEAAEKAAHYGARAMSLGLFGGGNFYLYGFLEVGDQTEQLSLVGEDLTAAAVRESVEDALRRRTTGFLKTVGVYAPPPSLPPEIMAQLQMQGRMPQQPPPEFDQIKKFLGQDYKVEDVDLADVKGVPSDIDILMVLKPKNLDERAVYGLDQYLMRGGRVVICSGKYETKFGPQALQVAPVSSGLDDWLKSMGVEVQKTLVLDDRNQPLPIPEVRQTVLGNLRTWVMKPYPYLVEVRDEGLVNRQVAASIDGVGIYWGSPISIDSQKTDKEGLKVIDLLKSSALSWTNDDTANVQRAEYDVPEGTESHLLGVALSGHFHSYFADKGAPGSQKDKAAADPAGDVQNEEAGKKTDLRAEVPLVESPETRLVVIGNAEFLSDFVANALSRTQSSFFLQNLSFTENLIDWATLDNDMLGIRARGSVVRRLDRVSRGTEVAVELVNYVVPVLVLILLGGAQLYRRRHIQPVVGVSSTGGAPMAGAPRRAEG